MEGKLWPILAAADELPARMFMFTDVTGLVRYADMHESMVVDIPKQDDSSCLSFKPNLEYKSWVLNSLRVGLLG